MNKRDRNTLHKIMKEMLSCLCVVKIVSDETHIAPSRIEAVMKSSQYGNVSITFYNGTRNTKPWLACRFLDWPNLAAEWKGWDHWKQNCHAQYTDPLGISDLFRNHLVRFKPQIMEESCSY